MLRRSVRSTPVTLRAGVVLAACVLSGCAARRTYDGSLVTDRPDFTESPRAVPLGAVQVEMGNTFGRTEGVRANTAGEGLVRIGVRPGSELRLSVPSYVQVDEPAHAHGFGDANVGAKLELVATREGPSLVPATGLIVGTGLPTGARAFRSRGLSPEAKLLLGWTLGDTWGLACNVNVASADDGTGRARQLAGSLSVSRSLGDRMSSYLEWFGNRRQDAGSANYTNAGVTWLLSSNEQLDLRAGRGLGATRGDYFVGMGLSRRW
jgi:hypothetical protein